MRIGIVASSRHPVREPFAGGLERHTHVLATALRARGHEVVVFASGDSDPELGVEPICPHASGLDLSTAATEDPSMLARRFMEDHHAYLHLMLRLAERDDLDIVQNSSLHHLPVAMAPTLPMPVVTTLHTPPIPWIESATTASPTPTPCTFVAVSRHTADAWTRVPVSQVVHNGIDMEAWPFREQADADLAIWTGRLVPEKGPHLAIDAAHRAGMRIHLAGPEDFDYVQDEVVPRMAPGDRLLGHLGQAELAEAVGRAAVQLCTPCWDEPFGLVAPEALACGTPVAAFDRGALPEILDDRCGRLAPAGDVGALAEAAAETRELDRTDARRHAETHFTIGAMVDSYEQLYTQLVAS